MPGPTGLVALQQLEVEMKTRKCFFPSVAHSLFMARFLKYQRFLKAHRVSCSHRVLPCGVEQIRKAGLLYLVPKFEMMESLKRVDEGNGCMILEKNCSPGILNRS